MKNLDMIFVKGSPGLSNLLLDPRSYLNCL
jgi:hypothetical protein